MPVSTKAVFQRSLLRVHLGKLIITIHTSKPGIIIGKGGGEVDRIKEELKKLTGKDDVQINILEIRRPELDAILLAIPLPARLKTVSTTNELSKWRSLLHFVWVQKVSR